MPPIIAIQFQEKGKQYHFDAQGVTDLIAGDRVVVETARGRQLGIVVGYVPEKDLNGRTCKPIERRATPQDLVLQQQWQAKGLQALVTCREQADRLGLKGYKFVKAEYNFDGSQVTILYTTEKTKGNLPALQRDLRRTLRSKVELYQIGPRDYAKQLDGLGACGEQRCCARFLTKFNSVSIRMAKLQNISLTPSEITGQCGRLRCCLAYEQEQYSEAAKGLPKRGKEVITPYGTGRVVEVRTLAGEVVVEVDKIRHVVPREDIGKTEFTTPPSADEKWPSWLPSDSAESVPSIHDRESASTTGAAASQRGRRARPQRTRPKQRRPAADQSQQADSDKGSKVEDSKPPSSKRAKSSRRRPRRRSKHRGKPSS